MAKKRKITEIQSDSKKKQKLLDQSSNHKLRNEGESDEYEFKPNEEEVFRFEAEVAPEKAESRQHKSPRKEVKSIHDEDSKKEHHQQKEIRKNKRKQLVDDSRKTLPRSLMESLNELNSYAQNITGKEEKTWEDFWNKFLDVKNQLKGRTGYTDHSQIELQLEQYRSLLRDYIIEYVKHNNKHPFTFKPGKNDDKDDYYGHKVGEGANWLFAGARPGEKWWFIKGDNKLEREDSIILLLSHITSCWKEYEKFITVEHLRNVGIVNKNSSNLSEDEKVLCAAELIKDGTWSEDEKRETDIIISAFLEQAQPDELEELSKKFLENLKLSNDENALKKNVVGKIPKALRKEQERRIQEQQSYARSAQIPVEVATDLFKTTREKAEQLLKTMQEFASNLGEIDTLRDIYMRSNLYKIISDPSDFLLARIKEQAFVGSIVSLEQEKFKLEQEFDDLIQFLNTLVEKTEGFKRTKSEGRSLQSTKNTLATLQIEAKRLVELKREIVNQNNDGYKLTIENLTKQEESLRTKVAKVDRELTEQANNKQRLQEQIEKQTKEFKYVKEDILETLQATGKRLSIPLELVLPIVVTQASEERESKKVPPIEKSAPLAAVENEIKLFAGQAEEFSNSLYGVNSTGSLLGKNVVAFDGISDHTIVSSNIKQTLETLKLTGLTSFVEEVKGTYIKHIQLARQNEQSNTLLQKIAEELKETIPTDKALESKIKEKQEKISNLSEYFLEEQNKLEDVQRAVVLLQENLMANSKQLGQASELRKQLIREELSPRELGSIKPEEAQFQEALVIAQKTKPFIQEDLYVKLTFSDIKKDKLSAWFLNYVDANCTSKNYKQDLEKSLNLINTAKLVEVLQGIQNNNSIPIIDQNHQFAIKLLALTVMKKLYEEALEGLKFEKDYEIRLDILNETIKDIQKIKDSLILMLPAEKSKSIEKLRKEKLKKINEDIARRTKIIEENRYLSDSDKTAKIAELTQEKLIRIESLNLEVQELNLPACDFAHFSNKNGQNIGKILDDLSSEAFAVAVETNDAEIKNEDIKTKIFEPIFNISKDLQIGKEEQYKYINTIKERVEDLETKKYTDEEVEQFNQAYQKLQQHEEEYRTQQELLISRVLRQKKVVEQIKIPDRNRYSADKDFIAAIKTAFDAYLKQPNADRSLKEPLNSCIEQLKEQSGKHVSETQKILVDINKYLKFGLEFPIWEDYEPLKPSLDGLSPEQRKKERESYNNELQLQTLEFNSAQDRFYNKVQTILEKNRSTQYTDPCKTAHIKWQSEKTAYAEKQNGLIEQISRILNFNVTYQTQNEFKRLEEANKQIKAQRDKLDEKLRSLNKRIHGKLTSINGISIDATYNLEAIMKIVAISAELQAKDKLTWPSLSLPSSTRIELDGRSIQSITTVEEFIRAILKELDIPTDGLNFEKLKGKLKDVVSACCDSSFSAGLSSLRDQYKSWEVIKTKSANVTTKQPSLLETFIKNYKENKPTFGLAKNYALIQEFKEVTLDPWSDREKNGITGFEDKINDLELLKAIRKGTKLNGYHADPTESEKLLQDEQPDVRSMHPNTVRKIVFVRQERPVEGEQKEHSYKHRDKFVIIKDDKGKVCIANHYGGNRLYSSSYLIPKNKNLPSAILALGIGHFADVKAMFLPSGEEKALKIPRVGSADPDKIWKYAKEGWDEDEKDKKREEGRLEEDGQLIAKAEVESGLRKLTKQKKEILKTKVEQIVPQVVESGTSRSLESARKPTKKTIKPIPLATMQVEDKNVDLFLLIAEQLKISDFYLNKEITSENVRNWIADHIDKKWYYYKDRIGIKDLERAGLNKGKVVSDFTDAEKLQYIAKIKDSQYLGDHTSLLAACNVFNINISLVDTISTSTRKLEELDNPEGTIYLEYRGDFHYKSVLTSKEEDKQIPPPSVKPMIPGLNFQKLQGGIKPEGQTSTRRAPGPLSARNSTRFSPASSQRLSSGASSSSRPDTPQPKQKTIRYMAGVANYLLMELSGTEDLRDEAKEQWKQFSKIEHPTQQQIKEHCSKLLSRALEASDVLKEFHKKGTHNDFKSANLAIDREGNLRLIDFGTYLKGKKSIPGEELNPIKHGTAMFISPKSLEKIHQRLKTNPIKVAALVKNFEQFKPKKITRKTYKECYIRRRLYDILHDSDIQIFSIEDIKPLIVRIMAADDTYTPENSSRSNIPSGVGTIGSQRFSKIHSSEQVHNITVNGSSIHDGKIKWTVREEIGEILKEIQQQIKAMDKAKPFTMDCDESYDVYSLVSTNSGSANSKTLLTQSIYRYGELDDEYLLNLIAENPSDICSIRDHAKEGQGLQLDLMFKTLEESDNFTPQQKQEFLTIKESWQNLRDKVLLQQPGYELLTLEYISKEISKIKNSVMVALGQPQEQQVEQHDEKPEILEEIKIDSAEALQKFLTIAIEQRNSVKLNLLLEKNLEQLTTDILTLAINKAVATKNNEAFKVLRDYYVKLNGQDDDFKKSMENTLFDNIFPKVSLSMSEMLFYDNPELLYALQIKDFDFNLLLQKTTPGSLSPLEIMLKGKNKSVWHVIRTALIESQSDKSIDEQRKFIAALCYGKPDNFVSKIIEIFGEDSKSIEKTLVSVSRVLTNIINLSTDDYDDIDINEERKYAKMILLLSIPKQYISDGLLERIHLTLTQDEENTLNIIRSIINKPNFNSQDIIDGLLKPVANIEKFNEDLIDVRLDLWFSDQECTKPRLTSKEAYDFFTDDSNKESVEALITNHKNKLFKKIVQRIFDDGFYADLQPQDLSKMKDVMRQFIKIAQQRNNNTIAKYLESKLDWHAELISILRFTVKECIKENSQSEQLFPIPEKFDLDIYGVIALDALVKKAKALNDKPDQKFIEIFKEEELRQEFINKLQTAKDSLDMAIAAANQLKTIIAEVTEIINAPPPTSDYNAFIQNQIKLCNDYPHAIQSIFNWHTNLTSAGK